MSAAEDIAKLVAFIIASQARPAPQYGFVQVPPCACLWPVDPAAADYPDLSVLGGAPDAPIRGRTGPCRPGDGSG